MAAIAVLLSHGAAADLVGHVEVRAAVSGKSDEELVGANPVLERLGRESPALLAEVLERLRAPAPEPPRPRAGPGEASNAGGDRRPRRESRPLPVPPPLPRGRPRSAAPHPGGSEEAVARHGRDRSRIAPSSSPCTTRPANRRGGDAFRFPVDNAAGPRSSRLRASGETPLSPEWTPGNQVAIVHGHTAGTKGHSRRLRPGCACRFLKSGFHHQPAGQCARFGGPEFGTIPSRIRR